MKELPESLSVETLLGLSLPDDVTLDVVRSHFAASDIAVRLSATVKKGRAIRIRFVLNTEPETEAPGTMTLAEFRKLTHLGKAFISIDDNGGGLRTAADRPKELV